MIAPLILLVLTMSPALAEPLPVPKPPNNGQCPANYASGASFCTPMAGSTRDAVPKGAGACPSNWAYELRVVKQTGAAIIVEGREDDLAAFAERLEQLHRLCR